MTIARKILTDAEMIALWFQHRSARNIAKATDSGYSVLQRQAKRLGLSKARKPFDEGHLRELWRRGLTVVAIGVAMGASTGTIERRADLLGLPRRGRGWKHNPAVMAPEATKPHEISPPVVSLAGHLIATKGSWASLSIIAAREGWTEKQVQARYHQAKAGYSLVGEGVA